MTEYREVVVYLLSPPAGMSNDEINHALNYEGHSRHAELRAWMDAMMPFAGGYNPTCRYVEASRYVSIIEPDMDILERAFERFNIGTDDIAQAYRDANHRSLSTGDIVTIDGKAYYCASQGWDDVPGFAAPTN